MSSDKELGKSQVETDALEQVLDAFSEIVGWNVTDDWDGEAERVEGSPDHESSLPQRSFRTISKR